MEQILVGGKADTDNLTTTSYNNLMGGTTWYSSTAARQQMVSGNGWIKDLRVVLDTQPGAGKSFTFTVCIDLVETALTVTISDTATTGADMKHRVKVKPGVKLILKESSAGTPSKGKVFWSTIFESLKPKESLLTGSASTTLNTASQQYNDIGGGGVSWSTVIGARTFPIPVSGSLKSLYVELSAAPGLAASGKQFKFEVYKNGIAQALSVTIFEDATSGYDITNSVSVVPGDLISLSQTPTNTPTASITSWYGCLFVANKDGESILAGSGGNNVLDILNVTYYYTINLGGAIAAQANDALVQRLTRECVLSDLWVCLRRAPGAGDSYTFTLRRAGGSAALTVTIGGAVDTSGSDITHAVKCDRDGYLDMMIDNTGVPVADNYCGWAMKVYVPPKKDLDLPLYRIPHMDNGLGLKRHPRSRAY